MKLIPIILLLFVWGSVFGTSFYRDDSLSFGPTTSTNNKILEFGTGATKGCIQFDYAGTELQFSHDCSTYSPLTYLWSRTGTTTSLVNTGDDVEFSNHKAATSAGITFKGSGGSTVATFGAGGGQGATFSDGVVITNALTANNGAGNSDFTVKKQTSGNAIVYDAGDDTTTVNTVLRSPCEGSYINNCHAERDVTGWTSSDGTNFPVARETTIALAGTGSIKFSKAASNEDGDRVCSATFTVARKDAAQVLALRGSGYTSSGYADSDAKFVLYDVENTSYKEAVGSGELLAGENEFAFYFQTNAYTGTGSNGQYQVCIEVNSTSTTAWDVIIDNVVFSKVNYESVSVMSDWKTYTPVWEGAATNPSIGDGTLIGYYRVVGDSIEGIVAVAPGSTTTFGSGVWTFGIPDNYRIDAIKLYASNTAMTLGTANALDSGTSFRDAHTLYENETRVKVVQDGTTDYWQSNVPITWTVNDRFTLRYTVPIQGLSSNQLLSSEGTNRETNVDYVDNSGESLTAFTTNIPFKTNVNSNSNAWDGSLFTAPETGWYDFSGSVYINTTTSLELFFYIDNGATDTRTAGTNSGTSSSTIPFSGSYYLEANQTLSFRTASNVTLVSNTGRHFVTISKRASPKTNVPVATVFARYTSDAGTQTIASGGTDVKFEDKVTDTHNICDNTGAFTECTCIYTGVWEAKAGLSIVATATADNQNTVIQIFKEGTRLSRDLDAAFSGQTFTIADTSISFYCTKNEKIKVTGSTTIAGGSQTLYTNPHDNYFTIQYKGR